MHSEVGVGDDAAELAKIIVWTDGSNGRFACVTDGGSCFWERNRD
jgi:hypothetical protein